MKNFIACKECKTVYRYSSRTSSDKIKQHKCYLNSNKQPNTTNSSSESQSNVKFRQSVLLNHSFKFISNNDSDKNIKLMCSDLMIKWICSNLRPFSVVEDSGLQEIFQFFYELGKLLFFRILF